MRTSHRFFLGFAACVALLGSNSWADDPQDVTAPAASSQPAGNLLQDPKLEHLNSNDSWQTSSLEGASVSISKDPNSSADHPAMLITVDKVDSTDWHAQIYQNPISITKGAKYDFTFTAKASAGRQIAVFLQELHSPYKMLSEGHAVDLTTDAKPQTVEMTATDDSKDGKLTIAVGQAAGTITLSDLSLTKAP